MSGRRAGRLVPFIKRVRVSGYRSIAECDVTLGPLTVLVGFNASGKSNFLDALRFVADALTNTPLQAVNRRGGLETLLHRSAAGTAESFEIWLDLNLRVSDDDITATYGFEIGPAPNGDMPLRVLREVGQIHLPDGTRHLPRDVPGITSRLRLPASPVTDDDPQAVLESALRSMCFYDLDSAMLRELGKQSRSQAYLDTKGRRLGEVLGDLATKDPTGKERLDAYLSALVPGALGVDERREGDYSTIQARFQAPDGIGEGIFLREELSEGTVRAAGVLAALFQVPASDGRIPLVAIEEPETALHPAGVGALYEALHDAAARTQVIVTSQSSDLLDNEYVRLDHLRVLANVDGVTRIGPVDAAGRTVVEKDLMSVAELHRSGRMRPEPDESTPERVV